MLIIPLLNYKTSPKERLKLLFIKLLIGYYFPTGNSVLLYSLLDILPVGEQIPTIYIKLPG